MYYICEDCGGRLDPGEKCDCQEQAVLIQKKWESMTSCSEDGQIKFNLHKKGDIN